MSERNPCQMVVIGHKKEMDEDTPIHCYAGDGYATVDQNEHGVWIYARAEKGMGTANVLVNLSQTDALTLATQLIDAAKECD